MEALTERVGGLILPLANSVSVYLSGGSVLLDSGLVATSADCCCSEDCSCPPPHPCAVSFDLTFNDPCTETTIVFSESSKQLELADPADCGTVIGDFLTTCWQFSSTFPSCAISFVQYLNWPSDSFCESITFQLVHYCGPWCEDSPTGWYLGVIVNGDNPLHLPNDCCQFANFNGGAACPVATALYLGTNPFGSDLPFTTDLDGGGSYGTSYGTITGTFHADCA